MMDIMEAKIKERLGKTNSEDKREELQWVLNLIGELKKRENGFEAWGDY